VIDRHDFVCIFNDENRPFIGLIEKLQLMFGVLDSPGFVSFTQIERSAWEKKSHPLS